MSNVVTGKVRLSYVALINPRQDLNGNLKYSVTVLLPKSDTITKAKIDKAIADAIEQGRVNKWNGLVPPQVPHPVHDGDGVRQDGSAFGDECKGHWVFTASTNADPTKPKPQIVDVNLQPIMNAVEIYSGMYGRVSVVLAPYFSAGKKGVGCYLNNVQKLEDGEPLGGTRASAEDDFGGNNAYAGVTQPMQSGNGSANQGYQTIPSGQAIDPITGLPL